MRAVSVGIRPILYGNFGPSSWASDPRQPTCGESLEAPVRVAEQTLPDQHDGMFRCVRPDQHAASFLTAGVSNGPEEEAMEDRSDTDSARYKRSGARQLRL